MKPAGGERGAELGQALRCWRTAAWQGEEAWASCSEQSRSWCHHGCALVTKEDGEALAGHLFLMAMVRLILFVPTLTPRYCRGGKTQTEH